MHYSVPELSELAHAQVGVSPFIYIVELSCISINLSYSIYLVAGQSGQNI